MKQFTGQTGTGAAFLTHPHPTTRLQSENTILPINIACDSDAALAVVDGRGTTLGVCHRSTPDVLDGFLGLRIDVLCGGCATVTLLRVRGCAVAAVEAAVLAEELVIACVGFVPGSCSERLV